MEKLDEQTRTYLVVQLKRQSVPQVTERVNENDFGTPNEQARCSPTETGRIEKKALGL
jgi:hypothetical protein